MYTASFSVSLYGMRYVYLLSFSLEKGSFFLSGEIIFFLMKMSLPEVVCNIMYFRKHFYMDFENTSNFQGGHFMKKLATLFLAMLMVFSCFACGSKQDVKQTVDTSQESSKGENEL